MKDISAPRIRILLFGVLVVALVLVSKLYLIQIVHSDKYRDRADRQYVRPEQSVFDRGSIFFTTKDGDKIAAATLESGFLLAINPSQIDNPENVYEKINAIFPLEKELFLQKAAKKNDPYEEVAKQVPYDKGIAIDALKIKGVRVYKERWRFYPGNTLAAQSLGFLSWKENTLLGRYGLERHYNEVLSRNSGTIFANFFVEIFSNINKTVLKKEDLEGDIITTIEPIVQGSLEKEISYIQKKYNSKTTGGIIMNPKTGEIYAIASAPTFNPNSFQQEKNVSVFGNPIVEDVYEMGSIVKPLTMAAGLDAGVVTPDTTYNDTGSVTLDKATFYNYDKKGRGVVDMQTVLSKSLNTGVAFVVGKLGKERFRDYMYKFGFAEKTGIDLPNEGVSLVKNLTSPREIEYATASFGQGIALSPIQITRALAALGNGGKLITPHIVKKIDYKVGISRTIEAPVVRQVISPETSTTISRMLTTVVDKALLEGKIKMEHYSIAAKTGTAQIADGKGKYYDDRYLHSFFGYFPSYDPQFIVFMFTVEPQGVEYASHSLAEPFGELAKFLINYYQIPPDR